MNKKLFIGSVVLAGSLFTTIQASANTINIQGTYKPQVVQIQTQEALGTQTSLLPVSSNTLLDTVESVSQNARVVQIGWNYVRIALSKQDVTYLKAGGSAAAGVFIANLEIPVVAQAAGVALLAIIAASPSRSMLVDLNFFDPWSSRVVG